MDDEIELGIPGIGPATLLDRGGAGFVYLAEQEDFGRQVAVKVLYDALEDEATWRRFDRECRAIGAVSHHPNIVVVHGRGQTADDRPYLVMEYRAGGSLADMVATRGRLTEAEVIGIGIKIGGALQVAHEAGVLHRDVKPANILLSAFNEPALADFGIARVEGSHRTTEGHISASVIHAPREILDAGQPTPRSDVYALASTLFELATGTAAFADPSDVSMWAVVSRVLGQDPPDPRDHGVSDGLAAVLAEAMSHDPDRRPPSAAAFVDRLERLGAASTDTTERIANRATAAYPALDPPKPADPAPRSEPNDDRQTAPDRSAPDGEPTFSRLGMVIVVSIVVAATAGLGVYTVLTAGLTGGASEAARTEASDPAPPEAARSDPNDRNRSDAGRSATDVDAPGDEADGGATRPVVAQPVDEPGPDAFGRGEGPAVGNDAGGLPFEPALAFPRAEIGPLTVDERYVLAVTGAPEDAQYRLVVDDRPVTGREATVPVYFPRPGRHRLQVEVVTDDRVELTAPVEIYVSDRPGTGFRVNLSAIRSRPENWPDALRQFDQMVVDGHDRLQLSLSTRDEGSALPFWNFFIDFGEDEADAIAYCADRELPPEACYVARR